ncbi:MAG: DUF5671 domain-containing protein [bacterium]|nr:DUF5671 domain-containing protein [bacterium]
MENNQTKTGLPAEKAGPKDVFLHLLAIIMLYVSVGSFIALIFQYINIWLPDPALEGNYYSIQSAYASMRWSVSILIVVFPVYFWSSWFLNKEYKSEPVKLELKVRKWLLYFTLFAMAIIIIGDLVTLIYNFLQGELTGRFLYKILAVLLVSATVFKYYLMDLKQSAPYKIFAYAVSTVLLVAVVAGFFVAGSPQSARLMQIDNTRAQNLQELQGQIVYYWQQKGSLPPNLEALRDSISGFVPPQDPETGAPYEYNTRGALDFSLCADFALPNLQQTSREPMPAVPYASKPYSIGGIGQNWDHDAGRACFDRTIDPDFYKPALKTQ